MLLSKLIDKIWIVTLLTCICNSVKDIEISADYFEGGEKNKEQDEYQQLVGNVKIEHENYIITTDSAKRFADENIIQTFGKVELKHKKEDIEAHADGMVYNINDNKLFVEGNVVGRNQDTYLYTDGFEYNANKQMVYVNEGGTIKNKDNNMKCNYGTVNLKTNIIDLSSGVEMWNSSIEAVCKNVNYNMNIGIITLSKDIKASIKEIEYNFITTKQDGIFDTRNNELKFRQCTYHSKDQLIYGKCFNVNTQTNEMFVDGDIEMITRGIRYTCDNAHYDMKKQKGELYGRPLIHKQSDNGDDIYLIADKFDFEIVDVDSSDENNDSEDELDKILKSNDLSNVKIIDSSAEEDDTITVPTVSAKKNQKKTEHKRTVLINGIGNIQIYNNNFQCRSNSITFKNNNIYLYDYSTVWNNKNQMFGKNISISFKNENIHRLRVDEKPLFIMQDRKGYYDQITSDRLIVGFKEGRVDKALSSGNVFSYYFALNDNSLIGVNDLKASYFCVFFDKKSRPYKVKCPDQTSGTFYSPIYVSRHIEKFFVKGFKLAKSNKQPKYANIKDRIRNYTNIPYYEQSMLYE